LDSGSAAVKPQVHGHKVSTVSEDAIKVPPPLSMPHVSVLSKGSVSMKRRVDTEGEDKSSDDDSDDDDVDGRRAGQKRSKNMTSQDIVSTGDPNVLERRSVVSESFTLPTYCTVLSH